MKTRVSARIHKGDAPPQDRAGVFVHAHQAGGLPFDERPNIPKLFIVEGEEAPALGTARLAQLPPRYQALPRRFAVRS